MYWTTVAFWLLPLGGSDKPGNWANAAPARTRPRLILSVCINRPDVRPGESFGREHTISARERILKFESFLPENKRATFVRRLQDIPFMSTVAVSPVNRAVRFYEA